MYRSTSRFLALAVTGALVMAACGGDDDADPETGAETTFDAPADDGADPDEGDDPADGDEPGGDDDPETTQAPDVTDTDPAADLEWDPDGEYTVAWTIGPSGFDPHVVGPQNVFYPFLAPVYDRLTMLDVDGVVEPMLALSWDFIEDGTILEIVLREDVEFHDGTPFNAEAVVANLDRAKNHPESTTAAQQLESVIEMEVIDEYLVHLTVDTNAAALPFFFTTPTAMMVSPAAFDTDLVLNPVGTGPYVVEDFGDDSATYVRAPGEYWDPAAQKAARFTLLGIGDDTARINALQTGEVDVVNVRGAAEALARDLAAGGEFVQVSYPSVSSNSIVLNRDSEALQDVRVRRALYQAIDRDSIRDDLLGGECAVTGQPLLPAWDGYDPVHESAHPFDPDAARDLLEEAGASDLTLLGYYAANIEPGATIAVIVQEWFAQIGVTLELEAYETQELTERWRNGEADLWVAFGSSLPDPGLAIERRINPVQNPGDLANFSPFLAEAREGMFDTRLTPEERTDVYREMVAEMVDVVHDLYICFATANILAAERIVELENIPLAVVSIYDPRFLGVRAD